MPVDWGICVKLPWQAPQTMTVGNYGVPHYILMVVLCHAWLQRGGPVP